MQKTDENKVIPNCKPILIRLEYLLAALSGAPVLDSAQCVNLFNLLYTVNSLRHKVQLPRFDSCSMLFCTDSVSRYNYIFLYSHWQNAAEILVPTYNCKKPKW